jgi:hypothetical protein
MPRYREYSAQPEASSVYAQRVPLLMRSRSPDPGTLALLRCGDVAIVRRCCRGHSRMYRYARSSYCTFLSPVEGHEPAYVLWYYFYALWYSFMRSGTLLCAVVSLVPVGFFGFCSAQYMPSCLSREAK